MARDRHKNDLARRVGGSPPPNAPELPHHGNDFTIMAQGKVVDFFSDATFQRGGVGLFCGRGEAARVRWVEVSHQHDALGRFCAYLAPLGATNVAKGGTLN